MSNDPRPIGILADWADRLDAKAQQLRAAELALEAQLTLLRHQRSELSERVAKLREFLKEMPC